MKEIKYIILYLQTAKLQNFTSLFHEISGFGSGIGSGYVRIDLNFWIRICLCGSTTLVFRGWSELIKRTLAPSASLHLALLVTS